MTLLENLGFYEGGSNTLEEQLFPALFLSAEFSWDAFSLPFNFWIFHALLINYTSISNPDFRKLAAL